MSGIIPDSGDPVENPDPEDDTELPGQLEQEGAEGEAVEAESEDTNCGLDQGQEPESESAAGQVLLNEDAESGLDQGQEPESESAAGQVLLNGGANNSLHQGQESAIAEGETLDGRDSVSSLLNSNHVPDVSEEQETAEDEIVEAELNNHVAVVVEDAENVTEEQEATEDDSVEAEENFDASGNARVIHQYAEEDTEVVNIKGFDNEDCLETLHNDVSNVMPKVTTAATGYGFCESTQAEDDQDLNVNNSECTGAEWSLEPEDSIGVHLDAHGAEDGAFGGYEIPNDEAESQRLELPVETHRTESDSQLSGNIIEEMHINSGAQGNDSVGLHTVEQLNIIENFGAASNVFDDDAWETNSLPEEEDYGPEGDRCLIVGNQGGHELLETEADQELELSAGAAASGFVSTNNQDFSDFSCPECVESQARVNVHVNGETHEAEDNGNINDETNFNGCDINVTDQGAAILEDDISVTSLTKKTKSNSESFEPECDQSLNVTCQENESSQRVSEVVTMNEHGSLEQTSCVKAVNSSETTQTVETCTIQENIVINNETEIQHPECVVTSEGESTEFRTTCDKSKEAESENLAERTQDSVQTEAVETDSINQTIETEHLVIQDNRSTTALLQENSSAKADNDSDLKTDSKNVLSNAHGAIPKSKQFQTYTESDSKSPHENSDESVKNTSKEESHGIDSEDELLSELDATLKINSDKTSLNSAISDKEESDRSISCDQCARNNLKCSLRNGLLYGDGSNIPDVKTLKRQLHQAKQLLLERECQISRYSIVKIQQIFTPI